MLDTLDAPAVRTWCRLSLAALGQAREEIDALNVYPVPDGDTGTNLYLTVESAAEEVDRLFDAGTPSLADALRAMAHGALLGARGNSGVILAQLLRGIAAAFGTDPAVAADAAALCRALRGAADAGYEAVAEPVEGTVLTVAAAAADAAEAAAGRDPRADLAAVAQAAYEAARSALARTPSQLEVLSRAGVVDAGGRGLVTVLGALADAVSGHSPMGPLALAGSRAAEPVPSGPHTAAPGSPGYEVIYLLDAEDDRLPALRAALGGLGDSLVVVGGDGLWNVHVHVDDPGAAVEAGIAAGRPHRIRITHFAAADGSARTGYPDGWPGPGADPAGSPRGVVSVVHGQGLAGLCTDSGATVVHADPDRPPSSTELAAAVRRARSREVVLLLNDAELRPAAGAAAEQLRREGVRVAVIPTRSPVQGLAALAVHEPGRRFDEDVVAMTSAAGATRYAELAVAEGESWTMAGVCQAGDVLGLIDGDVAVIGAVIGETAAVVLDRMLAAGGELVTLILGEGVPDTVADHLVAHVRRANPVVDTVVYRGDQASSPLLIGVE
ncbi:DAK2 domain-containing protein [Streptacidiphilus sp. PB12-B1b]|uniref:DAK2 domain-containing protein n=1 Tax=Streptacidiphilus sp. PB12-B1b TaxID=2705012 RepID=UPI0015F92933|nr:DAK2 domain-containing protein [Streptacidiphilus sp. PB12-B1b]QMU78940.1 DAK2 domain-containing protein [Streptacidiphilus sp. PB12-B1b]